MRFVFISRHQPTDDQIRLADERDIELIHVGDTDGFTVTGDWVQASTNLQIDGAVVVHAAAAVRLLIEGYTVGIFENANRAEVGQPPEFKAVALHIYDKDFGGDHEY